MRLFFLKNLFSDSVKTIKGSLTVSCGMRENLIKLLRHFEEESGFQNSYADNFGDLLCDYSVEEYLDFPNYRLITRRYNEKYPLLKHRGQTPVILSNSIRAELKRMEMDGFLMISTQEAIKYAYADSKYGPDYDEGVSFTSESIILTTKGKSGWIYFLEDAKKNPFATLLSIAAIIISIFALFLRK
ncbi:MAG: hypothetical protein Q8N37_01475 [bacterium]|nr:hypothetical protein [bacterium]